MANSSDFRAGLQAKIERLLRMGAVSPEVAQRMGITREQGESGTRPAERNLADTRPVGTTPGYKV
jgi:hypothetical protein